MRTISQFFITFCFVFAYTGCSKTFQPQDPRGAAFPKVQATILTGEKVSIPEFFGEKPALLLIGYVQDSQFDVDRWLLALKQLKTPITIAEIPVIQGIFPRIISSKINSGMKAGIPEKDWKIVFTVYKGAEDIARFLGNTKPRNVRVVLIDKDGFVRWFHDRGFSADRALELDALVRESDSNN